MDDLPRLVRERGDHRPAVVTIGNFDGLHQGHRLILDGVLQRSREIIHVAFAPKLARQGAEYGRLCSRKK